MNSKIANAFGFVLLGCVYCLICIMACESVFLHLQCWGEEGVGVALRVNFAILIFNIPKGSAFSPCSYLGHYADCLPLFLSNYKTTPCLKQSFVSSLPLFTTSSVVLTG